MGRTDTLKVRAGKISPAEIGPFEQALTQVRPPQVGPSKAGSPQVGTSEVCAIQDGSVQPCRVQLRAWKYGASGLDATKIAV